jgi:phosphate transport system substrate-binding protein
MPRYRAPHSLVFALVHAAVVLGCSHWCAADELAAYHAEREVPAGDVTAAAAPVSGTIRVWGSVADRLLIEHLEDGFRTFLPDITFANNLHGPESTFAGVYTGVADLAFMAREMRVPMETMAFEWVHHYKAFEVEVANAGLDAARPAANLAVVVHRNNPITRLTLRQLDGIFGADSSGDRSNLRKWGDVSTGEVWKDRPIHVYGPALDSIPALYIRTRVLAGSRKWNPDYREVTTGWSDVLASVARDPVGITFAPVLPATQGIKHVELAADDSGPFYALTAETAAARTYPLARVVTVALDREPDKPIDPKVKEFLRYILSREGQETFARDRTYIPLDAQSVRRQLERLE